MVRLTDRLDMTIAVDWDMLNLMYLLDKQRARKKYPFYLKIQTDRENQTYKALIRLIL